MTQRIPFDEIACSVFALDGPVLRLEYDGETGPSERLAEITSAGAERPDVARASRTRRTIRSLGRTAIRIEELTRLPFPDGAARTIFCRDALPFVARPRDAVRELHRVLSDDGFLLLELHTRWASRDFMPWRPTPQGAARLLAEYPGSLIAWSQSQESDVIHAVACGEGAVDRLNDNVGEFMRRMREANGKCRETANPSLWSRGLQWARRVVSRKAAHATERKPDEQDDMEFMIATRTRNTDWLFDPRLNFDAA